MLHDSDIIMKSGYLFQSDLHSFTKNGLGKINLFSAPQYPQF